MIPTLSWWQAEHWNKLWEFAHACSMALDVPRADSGQEEGRIAEVTSLGRYSLIKKIVYRKAADGDGWR